MKKVLVLAIAVVVVSALLLAAHSIGAESAVSNDVIAKKVDEVLKNQKAIMSDLAAMKEELYIIKVRVT